MITQRLPPWLWFVLLWLVSVASLTVVALLLRFVMQHYVYG